MIDTIPFYIPLLFIFSVVYLIVNLYLVCITNQNLLVKNNTYKIIIITILWVLTQIILTQLNVYNESLDAIPPKIILYGVLPSTLSILLLFNTKLGRLFIEGISLKYLHYFHIVRIPVEIGLYLLYTVHAIPEIMTFTGKNYDILAGLSAPFIIYFGFIKKQLPKPILLLWNILCLGLLLYIVFVATLSAPTPFQQFGFKQPNIAIFYLPYSLLPTIIVPAVFFAHLVAIWQLLFGQNDT